MTRSKCRTVLFDTTAEAQLTRAHPQELVLFLLLHARSHSCLLSMTTVPDRLAATPASRICTLFDFACGKKEHGEYVDHNPAAVAHEWRVTVTHAANGTDNATKGQ